MADASPPFGRALKVYGADRGGEATLDLKSGTSLQVFYFEWDDVNAGPLIGAGGHEAEVCNTAAGFTLLQRGEMRSHDFGDGQQLEFAVTEFRSPDGRPVWVFKASWLQGYGTWNRGEVGDRSLRLQRSFLRLRGAARVLQAGVFGISDQKEAWQVFAREVLSQVQWTEGGGMEKAEKLKS